MGHVHLLEPLMSDYIALKSEGVMGLFHSDDGFFLEEGITTDLDPGATNANRIRFQYYLQDSLAAALKPFSKQVLTQALKDSEATEVVSFMEELKSTNAPSQARIADYSVDDISGNTAELEAQGIFVIIVRCQMLATQDEIVLQTQVGPGVVTTQAGS
jgi:hypothetical protein